MSRPLVIPFFIPHQGCRHRCVFCNQRLITRGAKESETGRPGEILRLSEEIRNYLHFAKNRSRVELAFFGGNFLGLERSRIEALLKAVQPWIRQGLVHAVRCSTRPDTVTHEAIAFCRPFGLDTVELGVQSMDDRILALAERGHTSEDTCNALVTLKACGVRTGVQVMVGLPGDDESGALRTAETLSRLKPDFARIYPLLVLEGSRLAQWYRSGRYVPPSLDQAVNQTRKMVAVFRGANISVVRMGLQATPVMRDNGQMIAGPWHPAFGHLVLSALMLEQACEQIDMVLGARQVRGEPGEKMTVVLQVHPVSLSRLQGDRKTNLEKLARRYPGVSFCIERVETLHIDQVRAHI